MDPRQNGAVEPDLVQLDGGSEDTDEPTDELSARYRGQTPPNRAAGWEIHTVCRRSRSSPVTTVDDEELPPWTEHVLVTIHRETGYYRPEFEELVFAGESALREWVDA